VGDDRSVALQYAITCAQPDQRQQTGSAATAKQVASRQPILTGP